MHKRRKKKKRGSRILSGISIEAKADKRVEYPADNIISIRFDIAGKFYKLILRNLIKMAYILFKNRFVKFLLRLLWFESNIQLDIII